MKLFEKIKAWIQTAIMIAQVMWRFKVGFNQALDILSDVLDDQIYSAKRDLKRMERKARKKVREAVDIRLGKRS